MQLLLADAKIMADACGRAPVSQPLFEREAQALVSDVLTYRADELSEMLGCNRSIAVQNVARFRRFVEPDAAAYPAFMLYNGQAYKHLKADTLSEEEVLFAQQHLWITSFLYGMLRPLDGIRPYRMEGRVALPVAGGRSLFDYWKDRLTETLISAVQADDGVLVHLATEEFQHLFHWRKVCQAVRVVQPLFYVCQDGHYRMQAVWAKTCRGAMVRFILTHRITTPDALRAFSYEGFAYAPHRGEPDFPHFVRE